MEISFRQARLLRGLALLLSGAWLGALAFFAGGAGLVLRAAGSRHAGGLANRALLDLLDVSSYAVSAVLLALVVVLARLEGWRTLARKLVPRLLVLCAAATLASHLVITPELSALRDKLPVAIDVLPATDPLRQAWARLHGLSVFALLVRLVGVTGVFFLLHAEDR